MPEKIVLSLPDGTSGDQWRNLRDWLSGESELRGEVELVEGEPPPGTLSGGIIEALTVGAGSGGALTVAVSGIISWLRMVAGQRRQPVPTEITMTLPEGQSIGIKTSVAQAWSQEELASQIAGLVDQISQGGNARRENADDGPADA